ncbi:hypothetical protein [Cribrihabitans pelagius]|uniref:hypothetical protein n=1 Tax=Cribrihabitans pelagius TaxID=1765746 RepID=UPI003B5C0CB4
MAFSGRAIEARLHAGDPAQAFLPQAGRTALWRPAEGKGLRVHAGIATRQEVPPFCAPLPAKVIAHGASRAVALRRLMEGLGSGVLCGVVSNRDCLRKALAHLQVAQGGAGRRGYRPSWALFLGARRCSMRRSRRRPPPRRVCPESCRAGPARARCAPGSRWTPGASGRWGRSRAAPGSWKSRPEGPAMR